MATTKFIPYQKMSKKQKKEINNEKRVSWSMSPVTKIVPSKRVYNRKKVEKNAY